MKNRMARYALALCALALLVAACAPISDPGSGGSSYGFVWKGEFSAAPAAPEKSWAYYDTTRSLAFYWDGEAWLELRSAPVAGAPEIAWAGSLDRAPASPAVNTAYYDRAEARSWIWDGNAWLQLSTLSTSKNAKLEVVNGSALTLDHNLGLSNLTYKASYREGTAVRDISYFNASQTSANIGTTQAFDLLKEYVGRSCEIEIFGAAVNPSGKVLIAYCDVNDLRHGRFKIVDLSGAVLVAETEFSTRETEVIKVAALQNGNFVIGYMDYGVATLYYTILDPAGTLIWPESAVDTDGVSYPEWDLAALPNGNFAFTMMHSPVGYDNSGRVEFFLPGGASAGQYDFETMDYADAHDTAVIPWSDGSVYAAYKVVSASKHQGVLQHCTTAGADYAALKTMLEDCEDAWDKAAVSYVTASADTSTKNEGTASAKFVIDKTGGFDYATGSGGAIVGTETVTAVDLTPYTALVFDMYSTVGWGNNEYQILLDEDGNFTTTDFAYTVEGTTNTGAWRRHYIPLPANRDNLDAVTAIGFKALADKGDCSLWIDNVRLVKGFEPLINSGSPYLSGVQVDSTHLLAFDRHEDGSLRANLFNTSNGAVWRGIVSSGSATWSKACTLSNGVVCVAWNDGPRGYFSFLKLNTAGTAMESVRANALFELGFGSVTPVTVAPLPNREFLLVYRDRDAPSTIKMKVCGDYSLYVQETSTNQVKLWNYSGKTMTLYLSLDQ